MKAIKVWIEGQVGGEDISIPKTATPKWMKRVHIGMKRILNSHAIILLMIDVGKKK